MSEKLVNSEETLFKLGDIQKRLIASNEKFELLLQNYESNFSPSVDTKKEEIRNMIQEQKELIDKIDLVKSSIVSATISINKKIEEKRKKITMEKQEESENTKEKSRESKHELTIN